jgi:PHD/YefM family antitoxin component YafN of YafNO toxin-antitoxin module
MTAFACSTRSTENRERYTFQGPVIVTRHGKPVAVLLSVEDEDELERLVLAYSPRLRALLDTSRQQIRESGGIAHADFWQEIETATQ